MYEYFEHTADVGIRVQAASLEELFAEAGAALMAFMLDAPAPGPKATQRTFDLAADDMEELLHEWLSELLFTHETEHLVLGDFRVELRENVLTAEARAEPLVPERHLPSHEVKAVTYHALTIHQDDHYYLAEVVLDI